MAVLNELVFGTTSEQMNDRNKNDRTESCRSQRVNESASENAQCGEDPAADKGTDQAKNNVGDAAVAAAAREFAREPPGNEAEKQPCKKSARPPHHNFFVQ